MQQTSSMRSWSLQQHCQMPLMAAGLGRRQLCTAIYDMVEAGLAGARQSDWTQSLAMCTICIAYGHCRTGASTVLEACSKPYYLLQDVVKTQGPTSTDHLLNLCLDMDFTRFHCTTPLKAEDHHQVPQLKHLLWPCFIRGSWMSAVQPGLCGKCTPAVPWSILTWLSWVPYMMHSRAEPCCLHDGARLARYHARPLLSLHTSPSPCRCLPQPEGTGWHRCSEVKMPSDGLPRLPARAASCRKLLPPLRLACPGLRSR